MTGFLRDWVSPGNDLQHPCDAAVMMPTIVRPMIVEALRSIFAQEFAGRIQVLIGLDRPADLSPIESACQERPANCAVQVFWPDYSTSVRHGGLTPARAGRRAAHYLELHGEQPVCILESIRDHCAFWQSLLSMRRIDAHRRNASADRFRHSQSFARRRQRLS